MRKKRFIWEEKALLESWESKVQAQEEHIRGLLAQRAIVQNKTRPTVERECKTMGIAFEAGQVTIDALLRAEHKRVRILDHDSISVIARSPRVMPKTTCRTCNIDILPAQRRRALGFCFLSHPC